MTASGSKSQNGSIYHYYHCNNSKCKERFRVEDAHDNFSKHLNSIKLDPGEAALYHLIIDDVFKKDELKSVQEIKQKEKELNTIKENIENLQDKFVAGLLLQAEFKAISQRYNDNQDQLVREIADLVSRDSNFTKYLKYGITVLSNIEYHFINAPVEIKQKLISSIFPEKLYYSNNTYRTNRPNEVLNVLTNPDEVLRSFLNEKVGKNADLSTMAPLTWVLSNKFIEDLKNLSDVYRFINERTPI